MDVIKRSVAVAWRVTAAASKRQHQRRHGRQSGSSKRQHGACANGMASHALAHGASKIGWRHGEKQINSASRSAWRHGAAAGVIKRAARVKRHHMAQRGIAV